MSHREQSAYISKIKSKYPENFHSVSVLEVGSLDINGSVRQFFTDCDYIGIDVGEGKGVDIVCSGHEYDAPDNTFDTTISCECFEHNPYWLETFKNMIRMTKSGGVVIMTCATDGRKEHGTTRTTPADSPLTVGIGWDYYKNLNMGHFTSQMDLGEYFKTWLWSDDKKHHDLYFVGKKL